MARHDARNDDQNASSAFGGSPQRNPIDPVEAGAATSPRIICAHPDPGVCVAVRGAVEQLSAQFQTLPSAALLLATIESAGAELIVIADPAESTQAREIVQALAQRGDRRVAHVVVSRRHDLDGAVDAMRNGAIDYIVWPCDQDALDERIRAAAGRIPQSADESSAQILPSPCSEQIDAASDSLGNQVDALCADLHSAYSGIAGQLSGSSIEREFFERIGYELDVESLLRSTLEYLLERTGPTNAAVFLPTGHHDFNLGAYVNYDVPKETADVLLDHLADIIAPRFENERRMVSIASEGELRHSLTEQASWLEGSSVVVFSCHADDECLAIFTLFRDATAPFSEALLDQLEAIRGVFTEQLAKVVRVHHRHLPHNDWPGFDVEEDDSGGMAA